MSVGAPQMFLNRQAQGGVTSKVIRPIRIPSRVSECKKDWEGAASIQRIQEPLKIIRALL